MLKSRDITLPTKVHLVKAMVFPVVMYGCEKWTVKKAEHWRIDAFELWCWRRLLRVPWTERQSNQSILKEMSLEYPLERLMLKLKLLKFGHRMQRTDSLEKTLTLGMMEGRRRRDDKGWDVWMASPNQWTWAWVSSEIVGGQGSLDCCMQSMGSQRVGHDWATELNLTECVYVRLPSGASGKEPDCQCRRHKRCGFDPSVRKISWKRAQEPTLVFLPGESSGLRSLEGYSP